MTDSDSEDDLPVSDLPNPYLGLDYKDLDLDLDFLEDTDLEVDMEGNTDVLESETVENNWYEANPTLECHLPKDTCFVGPITHKMLQRMKETIYSDGCSGRTILEEIEQEKESLSNGLPGWNTNQEGIDGVPWSEAFKMAENLIKVHDLILAVVHHVSGTDTCHMCLIPSRPRTWAAHLRPIITTIRDQWHFFSEGAFKTPYSFVEEPLQQCVKFVDLYDPQTLQELVRNYIIKENKTKFDIEALPSCLQRWIEGARMTRHYPPNAVIYTN